jgi:hypothetical protein
MLGPQLEDLFCSNLPMVGKLLDFSLSLSIAGIATILVFGKSKIMWGPLSIAKLV